MITGLMTWKNFDWITINCLSVRPAPANNIHGPLQIPLRCEQLPDHFMKNKLSLLKHVSSQLGQFAHLLLNANKQECESVTCCPHLSVCFPHILHIASCLSSLSLAVLICRETVDFLSPRNHFCSLPSLIHFHRRCFIDHFHIYLHKQYDWWQMAEHDGCSVIGGCAIMAWVVCRPREDGEMCSHLPQCNFYF